MRLNENVVLGLDIGMGSVGWALVECLENGEMRLVTREGKNGEALQALGSRVVNIPENPKTKELLNVNRRAKRQQRRVIKRRASRMRAIRNLLISAGIGAVRDVDSFHRPKGKGAQLDPWTLRAEALKRRLSDEEFACALLHIGKHRGFRSNSKRDKAGDKTTGAMLKAVGELETNVRDAGAKTVGAYLAGMRQKRNRAGIDGKADYGHTMLRSLLEKETDSLFDAQIGFGQGAATEELRSEFKTIAFEQRPLRSTAELVGNCAFLEGEKRAPRFAPTAERFRLAQRLVRLNLITPDGLARPINAAHVRKILEKLGENKSITYKTIRRTLKLTDEVRFEGLSYGRVKDGRAIDPESSDVATAGSGGCGQGSRIFCEVLGPERYAALMAAPFEGGCCLDGAAKSISDNDDITLIASGISTLPLERRDAEAIMRAVTEGKFGVFRGVMHISIKAMGLILPHMIEAGDYAKGCELAGFDHAKARKVDLDDVRNPVVRRILREVRRQAEVVMREFGVIPGRVHVELMREVGKSVEERNAITKGIERRTGEKNMLREELAGHFGISVEDVSSTELLRYELWRSQQHKCAYYALFRNAGGGNVYVGRHKEGAIGIADLRDSSHATQIDHILPRSRTFDNSFHNLCLSCVGANQAKGGRTPYEWIGKDNPQAWHAFEEWIAVSPFKGLKRRNYLLKNLDAATQERFSNRNLIDSSYVSRLVMRWFEDFYARSDVPMTADDGKGIRRVFARPGALTAYLRREWGLERLKKDADGTRFGDRHHALDALLVACCSEGMLQRLTRLFKRGEGNLPHEPLPAPWPDFRRCVERDMRGVFVSRAEEGKTKGALHEETLRAIRIEEDGQGKPLEVLYERKPISSLKLEDLERIKDPERCRDVVEALRAWIAAGKPKDADKLPRSAKGDVIRRARIRRGAFSSGVRVPRGESLAQADNGGMVRTEVYEKNGKYYLVPVYGWQAAQGIRPNKAIVSGKHESEWLSLDSSFRFKFSLISNSYVLAENGRGEVKEGYFICSDRNTGAITLSAAFDRNHKMKGIGVQRLKRFEKYRVDRLGRLSLVRKEKRP